MKIFIQYYYRQMSIINMLEENMSMEKKREFTTWKNTQNILVKDNTTHSPFPSESWYSMVLSHGGVLSYIITPTSIGENITVVHNITKNTIDLTEYGLW